MLRILVFLLLMTGISRAEWDVNIPLAADNLTDFPVDNQENLDRLELVLRDYPKGITLSYTSASTITASTGGVVCADSTGATKRFRGNTSTTAVTFSDIDTGAEASSTTYYVYANCDATATTATFKISASSTTPTGLTYYKRIGSFINDGSSNITASSITSDSLPNVVTSQNSVVYLNNNTDLKTNTISNGFIGRTTTGSVSVSNGTTNYVPTGCYMIGQTRDSDGSAGSLQYACP